jgi:selenocysteine lyase/cysteine desulfurase
MDAVAEHDRQLARVLYEEAAARSYLRVLCPVRPGDEAGDRAAVLSFELPGCPRLGDLARILSDSHGVMCRTGHMSGGLRRGRRHVPEALRRCERRDQQSPPSTGTTAPLT